MRDAPCAHCAKGVGATHHCTIHDGRVHALLLNRAPAQALPRPSTDPTIILPAFSGVVAARVGLVASGGAFASGQRMGGRCPPPSALWRRGARVGLALLCSHWACRGALSGEGPSQPCKSQAATSSFTIRHVFGWWSSLWLARWAEGAGVGHEVGSEGMESFTTLCAGGVSRRWRLASWWHICSVCRDPCCVDGACCVGGVCFVVGERCASDFGSGACSASCFTGSVCCAPPASGPPHEKGPRPWLGEGVAAS